MRPLCIALGLCAACLSAMATAQEDAVLLGCDLRVVDRQLYEATLQIIEYRVETNRAVDRMLIFSPFSDPDVLGLIASDGRLNLAARELAANAILDQLYIADAYFQACSEHYLTVLSRSGERSLRLKGAVGIAALEHWRYLSVNRSQNRPPALLRLQQLAENESDPGLAAVLSELLNDDPSVLAGASAWAQDEERNEPYRRFDVLANSAVPEPANPQSALADRWQSYRACLALLSNLDSAVQSGQADSQVFPDIVRALGAADSWLTSGFMARFHATHAVEALDRDYPTSFTDFFIRLAVVEPDPYVRSLALAPLAAGPADQARSSLLNLLSGDASALVRLAAADLLKSFCSEQGVRRRIIAAFREEEDSRVRLRMLHSLVWPHADQPPPEVLAFLMARLRELRDPQVLEYIVAILGSARVRTATEPLIALARRSSDPVLLERINEALRRIRGGR